MAAFEIMVNGERRFVGEEVTAITLVSDWVARRKAPRVVLHVACRGFDPRPGGVPCGICPTRPPEVAGLIVRNGVGVCPECLRTCVDITTGSSGELT